MGNEIKVILLGDSITQGLGSKKVNFEHELSRMLGPDYNIINLAFTGTTINYYETIKNRIFDEKPDTVIVLYGSVDAQLRPNREGAVFKHLPSHFRMNGGSMLSPRPFYSSQYAKMILQKCENIARSFFRKLIYAIDGTEQWVKLEEFQEVYSKMVRELIQHDIRPILCSTMYIDEKLFPGSSAEYSKYNQCIQEIARENNCIYMDFFSFFFSLVNHDGWENYFNYDHFHPNGNGYLEMAKQIANKIMLSKKLN